MCSKRQTKEKWVGRFLANVKDMGNNQANRVEGSHVNLKRVITPSGCSLFHVFEQIDEYYRVREKILAIYDMLHFFKHLVYFLICPMVLAT